METPRGVRAAIYTDSKVTLDSLKNHDIRGYLIEKIREVPTSNHTKLHYTLQVGEGAHRD